MEVAKKVEVGSFEDLIRLVASITSSGLAGAITQSNYILCFEEGGKWVYGFLVIYHNFGDKKGLPVFYYVKLDKKLDGTYVLLKTEHKEEVELGRATKAGYINIPIVELKEKPNFLP